MMHVWYSRKKVQLQQWLVICISFFTLIKKSHFPLGLDLHDWLQTGSDGTKSCLKNLQQVDVKTACVSTAKAPHSLW